VQRCDRIIDVLEIRAAQSDQNHAAKFVMCVIDAFAHKDCRRAGNAIRQKGADINPVVILLLKVLEVVAIGDVDI